MKKITLLFFALLAFASKGYSQLSEGFEGATFPPPGWTSFIGTNGLGTSQNWESTTDTDYVSSGSQAAFVRYENVSDGLAEDWLVTPQFTVTAPNVLLAFYEAQTYGGDYGTEYTIRVSTTSPTNISSFVTIDTKTEADIPLTMTQRAVDLSAYLGQTIYVAFVMTQDDGDNWAIDDVSLEADVDAPNCAALTAPADNATDVAVGPLLNLTWDAPTTGDAPARYDVYFGTALPLTVDDLLGNFTSTSTQVDFLAYDTTYYWTVIPKNLGGEAIGCDTYSFTTESPSGFACLSAPYGRYPEDEIFTSNICDGVSSEDLTQYGYAGEYSLMNVTDGLTYEFSSSVDTDYITISSEDATVVYASGVTPVTWTASADMVVRFYTHTDDACGSQDELRARSVICSGLTISVPDCAVMTFPIDGAIDVPVNTAVTFTWDAPTTGDAPDSYDVYGGTTLPLTSADFIDNFTTTSVDFYLSDYDTTFYWMVVPKNLAGEATGCASFSFTTVAAPGYCLDAYTEPWPTETYTVSSCDGTTVEDITPDGDGFSGEFSNVNVIAGNTYEFISSVSTDFITISTDDGATAAAYGPTPLTWTATADGVVRFYTHLDDQCGTDFSFRYRSIMCTESLATPTFNANNFKAYPNPVKDILNLSVETTITQVQVTNLLGQVVLSKNINAAQGQIDVSNLATGTYLVKVASDDLVKTIKVIKQ